MTALVFGGGLQNKFFRCISKNVVPKYVKNE
jgi:hypothetical protein